MALLVIFGGSFANDSSVRYSSLKIYYIRWDVMTRTGLSPDHVRKNKHIYVELDDTFRINKIISAIKEMPCSVMSGRNIRPDVRIVLDFYQNGELVNSYYGDRNYLYGPGRVHMCAYNESFYSSMDLFQEVKGSG